MKKLIIFDLDGTVYQFKGGSFKKSGIYKRILKNTKKYIAKTLNKGKNETEMIVKNILEEYGNSISIGLEKEFGINRYDYFNSVWDIPAKQYVKKSPSLRGLFYSVKKNFDMFLVSDAPRIWVDKVLKELNIDDIFDGKIFSGEGNTRKEFFNAFDSIKKEMNVKAIECIVVGDQEETDIVPAKEGGMRTIFINKKLKSSIADYTIQNILEIEKALEFLNPRKKSA